MPEGDAVRRTARALDEALAGRQLLRADLRVPRHATTDLSGMTVDRTAVAGKHLLTRLLGRAGRITLHTHLRMDGRWVTGAAGPRPIAGARRAAGASPGADTKKRPAARGLPAVRVSGASGAGGDHQLTSMSMPFLVTVIVAAGSAAYS